VSLKTKHDNARVPTMKHKIHVGFYDILSGLNEKYEKETE